MSLAKLIIYESEKTIIQAIKQGVDVNESDEYGFRPLIEAIICQKPLVIKALLEHGADIEQKDIIGRTPLQWAVDRYEIEYCRLLLKHKANPNHYSLDGQPLMVNAILREQYDLLEVLLNHGAKPEFAEDFISAKLLGHRFELSGQADIVSAKGSFVPLSLEGFYLEFTCELLRRSLNNYLNSMPGQRFEKETIKVNKVLRALKIASQLMIYAKHKDKTPFMPVIDELLNTDLLIIPVGYRGHAITLVQYGELFAHCDRGVSHLVDTIRLYKLGNPYAFTPDLIKSLLYEVHPATFIEQELGKILALKPINKLPTQSQLAGNCSWANVEASVPASLFMLRYHEGQGSRQQTGDIKRSIMAFYKAWVKWDQDTALEEALHDFHQASFKRQLSQAMLMSTILVQRCYPQFPHHVQRAKKILSILCAPSFQFILRNIKRTYDKKMAGNIGKEVIMLLEKAGLNLKTLELDFMPTNHNQQPKTENNSAIKMTTALHIAALTGQIEAVEFLLHSQAIPVDYPDRTGSTALMYAAWKGHQTIVTKLIEDYHANPNLTNLKNGTALRYAKYAGHEKIVAYLSQFS